MIFFKPGWNLMDHRKLAYSQAKAGVQVEGKCFLSLYRNSIKELTTNWINNNINDNLYGTVTILLQDRLTKADKWDVP